MENCRKILFIQSKIDYNCIFEKLECRGSGRMKVIKGNIISTHHFGELTILEQGFLILDHMGRIVAVTDQLEEEQKYFPIIDYGDRLILHSFADMHLHAPQYPMVGMGMDLPLLDWLNTYTFEVEARFSDTEYAREVYHQLAADLIRWGTTRVVMFSSLHTEATWILMEELEKAGVTGYVGKVNMDRNGTKKLQETTEESKKETLRWLDGCTQFCYIKPIITPRFTPSCTDELMDWLGTLAQKKQLYIQSHMNENLEEIQLVKELVPDCDRYWQTYAKHQMWRDHTIMAHCVHIDENEIAALKKANVVVAHCADSNINICSGIAPIRHLVKEGVWVTLGSDIAGGAQLSMAEVITMTIRSSKIKAMQEGEEKEFLSVAEGYYLGTVSGHKYFGAKEGFCAGDFLHAIVVDDSDRVSLGRKMSLKERFERVIYRMKKENIVAVYSEGREVVKYK